MADLGFIALILALSVSIYSVIAFVLGAGKGYTRLTTSARIGILAACGLVLLAAYALYYALLSHDFQLEYVASYTSRGMPLIYTISAFWAGNAGSLLFMALFLSLLTAVFATRKQGGEGKFSAYSYAVIAGTLSFLLLLLILTANPFVKLSEVPTEGAGLNPVLENFGMVLHPPLLLAGYIAFTIPFALVISALITKNEDRDWLPRVRTWVLLGWLFLGVGNLIGAWWAYVELGWGGYWAWDPVENAGLMPWLIGTALLHSISIQRSTRMLRVWTILLTITAFNLCIFGTFLTRSGFLSSVHTFVDTGMETLFLTFLAITLIGPLFLVLSKRSYLRGERREGPLISKQNAFILTNILFIAATSVIFLGTMFPWLSEKIAGSITTLESSFFDKAVGPILLSIILLAGICILIGCQRTSLLNLVRKAIYPLIMSIVLCMVLYIVGIREWYALILFTLCFFIVFTHLFSVFRDINNRIRVTKNNPLKALAVMFWVNRPHYGGMIVHLGITLIAIGIIGSSFYQSESEAALMPGDSTTIENYTITYEDLTLNDASTKLIFTAKMSIYDGDNPVGVLEPEYTIDYKLREASEVAIRSMPHWWLPKEDLYLALGLNKFLIFEGWSMNDALPVKVIVNPLVSFIWIGGGVLTLGGLFAFWPGWPRKSSRSQDKHKRDQVGNEMDSEALTGNTSDMPPELNGAPASEEDKTD